MDFGFVFEYNLTQLILQENQQPAAAETPPATTYRVKLIRPEYYCMPPAEELEEQFLEDGTCRIEAGLTVGRLGYGSVFWKGPVVLEGPVDLDAIVHFRNKEVKSG